MTTKSKRKLSQRGTRVLGEYGACEARGATGTTSTRLNSQITMSPSVHPITKVDAGCRLVSPRLIQSALTAQEPDMAHHMGIVMYNTFG